MRVLRATVVAIASSLAVGCASDAPAGGGDTASSETAATSTTSEVSTTDDDTTGVPPGTDLGDFDCVPNSRPGAAGSTDDLLSIIGVRVAVRTPADYDPTVAYPLLVVVAPGGANASGAEAFMPLTDDATGAGFVIAYIDSYIPASESGAGRLADLAAEMGEFWCIDESRVFFTGHSAGGTASTRVALYQAGQVPVRAIAPSAAGVDEAELLEHSCPEPASVMVIHSTGDTFFPITSGFGDAPAQWWAACMGCDPVAVADGPCAVFEGCSDDVQVKYCETTGSHGTWSGLDAEIIGFFAQQ